MIPYKLEVISEFELGLRGGYKSKLFASTFQLAVKRLAIIASFPVKSGT